MNSADYQELTPFRNCALNQLIALYPVIAVGRQGGVTVLALSLDLDDNTVIFLREVNGLFHKYKESPQKKPIDLDGLYRLLRIQNQ